MHRLQRNSLSHRLYMPLQSACGSRCLAPVRYLDVRVLNILCPGMPAGIFSSWKPVPATTASFREWVTW